MKKLWGQYKYISSKETTTLHKLWDRYSERTLRRKCIALKINTRIVKNSQEMQLKDAYFSKN